MPYCPHCNQETVGVNCELCHSYECIRCMIANRIGRCCWSHLSEREYYQLKRSCHQIDQIPKTRKGFYSALTAISIAFAFMALPVALVALIPFLILCVISESVLASKKSRSKIIYDNLTKLILERRGEMPVPPQEPPQENMLAVNAVAQVPSTWKCPHCGMEKEWDGETACKTCGAFIL